MRTCSGIWKSIPSEKANHMPYTQKGESTAAALLLLVRVTDAFDGLKLYSYFYNFISCSSSFRDITTHLWDERAFSAHSERNRSPRSLLSSLAHARTHTDAQCRRVPSASHRRRGNKKRVVLHYPLTPLFIPTQQDGRVPKLTSTLLTVLLSISTSPAGNVAPPSTVFSSVLLRFGKKLTVTEPGLPSFPSADIKSSAGNALLRSVL